MATERPVASWQRVVKIVIAFIAIVMVIYQIISPFYYFFPPLQHQNVNLSLSFILVFLSWVASRKMGWQIAPVLMIAGLIGTAYVFINWFELELRSGFPTPLDLMIGIALIVVTLSGAWFCFGPPMPIVTVIFIIYVLVGKFVPGPLHTAAYSLSDVIGRITMSTGLDGLYGTFQAIAANFLFLFMLFGGVFQASGVTRFFEKVGSLIIGKLAGGPPISAVVTSALMGTITGAPTSNIATIGAFTIPFMKKSGYSPEEAAGYEACASTGGAIMPPVMGTVAFIMAGMTGIPYGRIIVFAAIPAILYYLSIGLYAQFSSLRKGLKPIKAEAKLDKKDLLWDGALFIVPLGVLTILILRSYSMGYSGAITILVVVVMSLLRKKTRPSLKTMLNGFVDGANAGAQVTVICALLGLMAGAMFMTGLGIKLPGAIEGWSGGNVNVVLLMTMVVAIILGCGLPTSAVYLVVVVTVAPALIRLGIPTAQAHLFVLYYAVLGYVTPPVAMASIVAAKMAKAEFWKTSIQAMKMCVGGLLVPFMFVAYPVIMLMPTDVLHGIVGITTAITLILSTQIAICDQFFTRLKRWERVIFALIASVLFVNLFFRNNLVFYIVFTCFIILTLEQWLRRRSLLAFMERSQVSKVVRF